MLLNTTISYNKGNQMHSKNKDTFILFDAPVLTFFTHLNIFVSANLTAIIKKQNSQYQRI